jgi:membrane-associated phospholipid phosphatase
VRSSAAVGHLLVRLASRFHDAVGRADRRLPRGIVHLCAQFLIWIGFYFAYNLTRGLADRDVAAAFENGRRIAEAEAGAGALFEPALQRATEGSLLAQPTALTYWLSQFVIVGVALFWVYLRHHDRFAFFRNWLIVANSVGLACYALLPTAPPRMLPEWGFADTLAQTASVDHGDVGRFANQYAAMPSLHAMDALVVGVVLFTVTRRPVVRLLWLAWPAWVSFALMATGNHFWLDIAAGGTLALAVALALRPELVRQPVPRRPVADWRRRVAPARAPSRRG